MPELPEVEFARSRIQHWLGGRRIERIEADRTRILRGSSPEAVQALAGHTLEKVERRGKWLLWHFDSGLGLLDHLGMTGKFVLQMPGDPPPRSSRVRFAPDHGAVVHYTDPRMFGRMSAGPADELAQDETFRSLGPDAWNSPPTPAVLCAHMKDRKRPVKDLLMDQTVLAGLGNIYATEALFNARLHPARKGASLTAQECRALVRGIHKTLDFSLKLNKGDKITYVEEAPADQNPFQIYGRAGEPCPHCGTILKATQIGGRTSVFCPKDQPLRPPRRPAARPGRRR
jgi:formamidopyrimidine-DNA glycosylase